jgi:hypothetical protein
VSGIDFEESNFVTEGITEDVEKKVLLEQQKVTECERGV